MKLTGSYIKLKEIGNDVMYCSYEYMNGKVISCSGLGKAGKMPILRDEVVFFKEGLSHLKEAFDNYVIFSNGACRFKLVQNEFESSLYMLGADGDFYYLRDVYMFLHLAHASKLKDGKMVIMYEGSESPESVPFNPGINDDMVFSKVTIEENDLWDIELYVSRV